MSQVRYHPLGPLTPGEGTRPFLALAFEDGAPPRPVVLVWAPTEVTQDPTMLSRLRKETERAIVFEHPNILRVHELVTLGDRVARVTEFADGEPLRQILETAKRLPPPFAALVAADVAMGVHYAHMAGNDDGTPLIHADLRPETVMVSFNGVCKVSGYGALGVAPRESDGRRVRNRRIYSAPEQLMGGREASSVLTDVFLLGLLLHECLTGNKPFQDSINPDKAILNRPLPPLPAEVPLALNEVVRRATAKRAGERYPTALAFREALVGVMGDLPSHAAFADLIAKLIPPDNANRIARKKTIEQGIEEARRRAPPVPPPPLTLPNPVPILQSEPGTQPPSASVSPAVSPAPGTGMPPAMPVPGARPSRRSSLPIGIIAIAALLLVSAVGTVWSIRKKGDLAGPEGDSTEVSVDFETPVLLEAEAPVVIESEGTGVPKNPSAPRGPHTTVQIFVQPDVPVTIDGRAVGSSPLTVPLTPGRHMIRMIDAAKGLRTARLIDVRATGETVTFRIRLGMGSVLVLAPSGSRIELDGKVLGTAPLPEQTLFEGEHHVRVTKGDAFWERSFVLQGDKRMVFTPELTKEDAER